MDEQDRALLTALPAAVDDLLAAAFHFRVGALHRGKVEVFCRRARCHRRGRAATQSDQHGGAAEHHQRGAGRELALLDVFATDVAQATGQHDRLVVAAQLIADLLFVGAEIAAQVRAAEFVVEGGGADRALEHDVERRDDAPGLAEVFFPGLLGAGDAQVGDREAAQARLRLGALAGGALVADLAAGAGGRARVGRDRGRVVVGLHLHQDVDVFLVHPVNGIARLREETQTGMPAHHRGVVLVGRQHIVRRTLGGVADHAEQRVHLHLAVDDPVGVEDLVAAVLGVGLREHHQFNVVRIAAQLGEAGDQVIDLVIGQRQTQLTVGLEQCLAATTEHIHAGQLAGLRVHEQRLGHRQLVEHHLGHAVVQLRRHRLKLRLIQGLTFQVISHTALDAHDRLQAAVVRDIGGLGRPGRDGAGARHHQDQLAIGLVLGQRRAVTQHAFEHLLLGGIQIAVEVHEMGELGVHLQLQAGGLVDALGQFLQAKIGKRGCATEREHRGPSGESISKEPIVP